MLRQIQIWLMIAVVILAGIYVYARYSDVPLSQWIVPGAPVVHIQDKPFRVEIADSPREQERGLSGRSEISDVSGLFFVYDEPGFYSIWMKDMRFAIDIIWISENLEVIDIDRNVTPSTYPDKFEPSREAKYILETEAFFVETYGIKIGDPVRLPPELAE